MTYMKSLDGIRAIAVTLVVLQHFGYIGFGWIGVQFFFVLSGYLITTILVEDKNFPLIVYLKKFYWRRILRIFPLYYGVLIILTVSYIWMQVPVTFGTCWPYAYSYCINILRIMPNDAPSYLAHFWSLAVEEQFYLFWPFVVFFMDLDKFKKVISGLIILVPIFRLAIGAYLGVNNYNTEYIGKFIYLMMPFHLDAFAAGAAVSVFQFKSIKGRATIFFTAAIGVTILAGSINCLLFLLKGNDWIIRNLGSSEFPKLFVLRTIGYPSHMFFNYQHVWGYTLLNFVAATAILGCKSSERWVAILETKPFVSIGKVSYGIYVYHLPLLILAGEWVPIPHVSWIGFTFFLIYASATYIVSLLSFNLFERKFLLLKDRIAWNYAGVSNG